jgi:hypothetical protein
VDRLRDCARRELVFLALGTMDVCVITPLFAALLSRIVPVRPFPVTVVLLGTVLGVHYLARLSLQFSWRPALRSSLLGLGVLVSGLLAVYLLLHAQMGLLNPAWLAGILSRSGQASLSHNVTIFLSALFLWWRGVVLAQRRLDSESVAFRFRLGLLMLAVTTLLGGSMLSWPYHRFVFLFFFASLLGIALARAEEVGEQYGGRQSPFNLGWLATLVVTSLAVLLLAGGVAALLTGENLNLVIRPVLELLRILFIGVVYVLAWIAQVVLTPLLSFFQQRDLGRALEKIIRQMGQSQQPGIEMPPQGSPFTAEQLALARTVGVIVGVLLLLLLVALSLRRMRVRAGRRRDEERESVWEGADLRQGLRDLLRRGRRGRDAAAAALSRSFLGRLFAALTIRRIYAHLGALAAERGYPRSPYQTPYEYLPTLEQAFPESHAEVACITEAYVAVHYGEVPERPEELAAVRAAWEGIQGREAGGEGRRSG